ncbi:MAG: hypothetical protein JRJ02_16530 [Deltaproteobacteria bacterium]|nr:hypothetical protein [Deltaproteobacteria bacterium]
MNEYLSQADSPEENTSQNLALHLAQSINAVSLVTPLSLIATSILANHRRGFYALELTETVDILLRFLKIYEAPIADTLTDPSKAVKETLSLLISWKVVDFMQDADGDEEPFYYVD